MEQVRFIVTALLNLLVAVTNLLVALIGRRKKNSHSGK